MSICKFSIKEFVMTLLNNFPWSTLSSNINSIWPIQYYHIGFKINLMKLVIGQFRASTSVDAKLRKIQKVTNFTHFAQKIFHIDLSKTVYTCATLIVYICTVTVAMYPIILLISHFTHFFLSLLRAQRTQSQTSPILILFFFRYTQTHPHPHTKHTNTSTQKNQHRDTQTYPHTNTPTWTNQQRDILVLVLVAYGSVLVALNQSSWVNGNGSGCLWIGVGGRDQYLWVNENGFCFDVGGRYRCLWVDWNDSLHVHLLLRVNAYGRDNA